MHESGSPAWSIEPGDHRKWFDAWRIVTGVLTVPFLVGSVEFFSQVGDDASVEVPNTIIGLDLLAVAACFGAATLIRSGGSGRRVFTTIGVTLVLLAAWVYGLLMLVYAVSINAQ